MDSILTSVKKMIGIDETYDAFDDQIIMCINTVFMTLKQLGVGPTDGYFIEDSNDLWSDYLGDNDTKLRSVRTYTALKVKMMFDPPTSSIVADAMNKSIAELEWRINGDADQAFQTKTE